MTFFVWLDVFPKEINDLWKFLKISFKYYVQSNKWKEVLGEFAETYITISNKIFIPIKQLKLSLIVRIDRYQIAMEILWIFPLICLIWSISKGN